MTVKVDKEMRKRIDVLKSYLYRETVSQPYDDVSGVRLDAKSKLSLEEVFDDVQEVERSLRKIKANIATLLQQAGG